MAIETVDAELTLTLDEQGIGALANNLTTTDPGWALDARQGKVLDEKKLDAAKVANNLTTLESGWALDARQGKWLNENKLSFSDVANDLSTDDASKVLSAAQGKRLAEEKLGASDVVDTLASTSTVKPLSANQGRALKALADGKAEKTAASVKLTVSGWSGSGPYTQEVSVSAVTASNDVIAAPAYASLEAYNDCLIGMSAQAAGSLTFTAQDKPSAALTVNLLILT